MRSGGRLRARALVADADNEIHGADGFSQADRASARRQCDGRRANGECSGTGARTPADATDERTGRAPLRVLGAYSGRICWGELERRLLSGSEVVSIQGGLQGRAVLVVDPARPGTGFGRLVDVACMHGDVATG